MKTTKTTFIILMLYCMECKADEDDDLIDYYENVIRTGINDSLHYELPTSADSHRPKDDCETQECMGEYDFIVIGSGPGGAVVANRLSEVKEWNVLLLEAGTPESNFSIIPAMKFYMARSKYNWGYKTTSQLNSCLGKPNSQCSIPKGKGLGGTTAINGLIYSRGHKSDYERWKKEGNPGWSFAEVLPYFIKSENSQIDGDPGYHGKDGYMNVMYHRPHSKRCKAFLKGSQVLFPSSSKDYNGREEFGAFYSQFNKINQFRQSSSKAFLEPIMDRPNLKILTNSYVTKILIDPRTKTAFGVTFTKDGECFTANASKEVILSAGVFNSPQLLMLSGIGPRQHLKKMNIPLIQDLPVGKSLYQHSLFYGAFTNTNSTAPVQSLRESVKQFLNDYGPLTIPANNEGLGFYRSSLERSDSPDFELAINLSGEFYVFEQIAQFTDEVRQALFEKVNRDTFIHTYIYLLKPKSMGTVTLESNDPFKYPLINSNCLDKQKDINVLFEAIQTLERIIATEPFQKINASMVYPDYPQCKRYPMRSKRYWVCALKLLTDPGSHQMSSCRMGPNRNTSVVGSRGKVHGVKQLRVVDASIIPFAVAGHPAAPIFMLAEKISDYIKQDYGVPIDPITNVI